jgi:hypothetical protein
MPLFDIVAITGDSEVVLFHGLTRPEAIQYFDPDDGSLPPIRALYGCSFFQTSLHTWVSRDGKTEVHIRRQQ